MKKIAFVLNTTRLEYDDRVRKEALTLSEIAQVKIFVVLANNKESEGITTYGIPYKSFRLKTRDKLPQAKFLLIKAAEFFWRVRKHLKGYDIVWVHEVQPFLFPLLLRKKKIVWDLHEIPHVFEKSSVMRHIFRFIEKKCMQLVHANYYRIEYLIREGLIKKPEKHIVIRNYPDTQFEKSTLKDDKYDEFKKWLGASDYIYLQGLNDNSRFPRQTIEAVMNAGILKAVVVGNFVAQAKQDLLKRYGDMLCQKIFFRGNVDQLAIPNYVKGSLQSIILYDITFDPGNNRYCEPNRMYQAILFDKPVVVGCNEPMSDLVKQYGFGIALKSDGRNVSEITDAIGTILNNYDIYVENIKKHKENIVWSKQEEALKAIIE